MALITLDFESEYMGSNQNVNIIVPDKPRDISCKDFYGNKVKYRVLWLLHGTFGGYSDWIRKSNIETYACEKNFIVVMPGIANADYEDWPTFTLGLNAEKYIVDELMPLVYNWLPASNKREDNFIAGLSMGGKGTLHFALKYPQLFAKAAILSYLPSDMENDKQELEKLYALSLDEVISNNDVMHSKQRLYNCMHNIGSVDAYLDSYYNLRRKMKEADVSKLPEMLFTCGTEDSIFKNEIEPFKAFLKEIGMEAKWSLGKGDHEWRVWERDIQIAFSFFVDDQQVHGNAF